ncbi:MAG TPA: type II toxin-antitoxin system VapC family toxin [Acidobacteriaceae bacterium]|nr:type II toxin-antitoxin system VapC family toxin [Acidobacteriaceae bacterium]
MASFIPDASVAIPWCARDEATPWTDSFLHRLRSGDTAIVPPIWPYEITNTLLHLQRRNRVSAAAVARFLDDLRALPIEVDAQATEQVFDRVADLAGRHTLTAYDAAYLELAQRRRLSLARQDRDLRRAAQAEGIVLA